MYPLNHSIILPEKEEPYVLLKGGYPVGFYPSYTQAARAANTKFSDSRCELRPINDELSHSMFPTHCNYERPSSD